MRIFRQASILGLAFCNVMLSAQAKGAQLERGPPDQILWVSPNGQNGNHGGRTAPVKSIQLALDRATPGTAILLEPGTYIGNFEFKVEGVPHRPVWLVAGLRNR